MRIYFSFDPTEQTAAQDLHRALKTLLPDTPWEFWDPGAPTDTTYYTDSEQWLKTARMAIIVHGDHYALNPRCHRERMAIVAEKQRRPKGFDIVVVQAQNAVIHPDLKGFVQLPADNEVLKGTHYKEQIKRSAQAIGTYLAGVRALHPWVTQAQNPPVEDPFYVEIKTLSLSDLRERLHELTDRHNLSDVLLLLKSIVKEAELVRAALQLEDDFVGMHLRKRKNFEEYAEHALQYNERTRGLIDALQDESQMQPAWAHNFLEMYRTSAERKAYAFYLPYEDIQIPESLNLPVATDDAGSAERVGLLSYEQKLEYRRLLVLCQDDLNIEKPARAHGHADKVRTQIDPLSAQLYEYLMIAFVQKEGPANIMRRYMEGIKSDFNTVKLYSDRFELYQNGYPQRCPTATGGHNRAAMVEELASGLLQQYQHIPGHAILDTGDYQSRQEVARPQTHLCMDALMALHQSLVPTTIMLENLILEVIGSGKCHWMQRMEIHNDNWVFVGNADFDLLGKTWEFLVLLDQAENSRPNSQVRNREKQREMLREDLFWALFKACQDLKRRIRTEQDENYIRTDVHASVIRIIRACVLGHHALTQTGDELEEPKSLLRLALELLLPNLLAETGVMDIPAEVVLDWFDLDEAGQLTNAAICTAYDFDAVAVLRKIVLDKTGESGWAIVERNAREEVWKQYAAHTDTIYEGVREALKYDDFRRMNDLEARKRLVTCLRRWEVSRRTYPERGLTFQRKIMDELTGQGLLMWFIIQPQSIDNQPDTALFEYDPQREVTYQSSLPNAWSDAEVTRTLVGNLYLRQVVAEWDRIPARDESRRKEVAAQLGRMILAFQKHPVPLYLDLVYRELTEEIKLKWIGVDFRGKWHNTSDDLDALYVLRQLTELLPGRFSPLDTRRRIADLRWRDWTDMYYRDISDMRQENRFPERKMCAQVIWGLKGVYQFYPDIKYLELPITELFGRGRVRWFARILGILASNGNHIENSMVPFDLRAERIELKMYRDSAAQLFEQMMQEIGMGTTGV
jgi:hypothetical protein